MSREQFIKKVEAGEEMTVGWFSIRNSLSLIFTIVMKAKSIEEIYTRFSPVTGADSDTLPERTQREVGHVNIFNVADMMRDYRTRPPMTFDRRAYHKISLVRGPSQIEHADQVIQVEQQALWFASPRVPYRWVPQNLEQSGHFCIFNDEFLLPARGMLVMEELPVFQPGGCPVIPLNDEEYRVIEVVFQKMAAEIASDYAYKYDLIRAHLLEIIHMGQKLQPAAASASAHNASARLTALFADLLERQFPLESPQQRLPLRTAKDYADRLSVHVNHLNRVLKETTGQTTTDLIGGRVVQEAKMLLKQTNWTVSEIADGLGFADVAHFCNFFKRQTGLSPGALRD